MLNVDVILYMLEQRLSSGIFFANLHRGAYSQTVCGCVFATPPGHCMEYTLVVALGSINPPLWFTDKLTREYPSPPPPLSISPELGTESSTLCVLGKYPLTHVPSLVAISDALAMALRSPHTLVLIAPPED